MDLSDVSNCASLGFGCYLGWQPPKMSLLSFSQLHLLNIIFVFNLCVCVCVHICKCRKVSQMYLSEL